MDTKQKLENQEQLNKNISGFFEVPGLDRDSLKALILINLEAYFFVENIIDFAERLKGNGYKTKAF